MSLWNQGGGGPKKFGNPWFKVMNKTEESEQMPCCGPIHCTRRKRLRADVAKAEEKLLSTV
jgi:hypothetical protein